MSHLAALYGNKLSLLTDLYQLTMAQAAWTSGLARKRTVFHLFFRRLPFQGGYALAAGLDPALDFIQAFQLQPEDLEYLRGLQGNDGRPLFTADFLEALAALRPEVDVDAMPEGTCVFGNEPLLRISGPALSCMILETPLLALINFQTLVATKAARIREAAGTDTVLEFGLRRAQGVDGALSASRAAYLGGCDATSNALAGRLYDIPVRGTHAHSWVMLFEHELDAFRAYAKALPNNCVFLVDTYRTLSGVAHAIEVGRALRQHGHALAGVRLDSGDLAYLSIEARRMLDAAGFPETKVLATNDLDEKLIESLKHQGARIDIWGVGTKLVTAYDEPALGGVYKLGALEDGNGGWAYRLKLSEQPAKVSTPGILQVRRYEQDGGFVADMVYDVHTGVRQAVLLHPDDVLRRRNVDSSASFQDLLVPVLRQGQRLQAAEPLTVMRARAEAQRKKLHPGIRRFVNPHVYPVGLEGTLHAMRTRLMQEGLRDSQVQP